MSTLPAGAAAALETTEAPRARPLTQYDWKEPWKGPFLEAMARMPNKSDAARMVGISLSAVKKARKTDENFRVALDEAIEIGVDLLERIYYVRATVGEPRRQVRTRTKRDGEGKLIEEETTVVEDSLIDTAALHTLLRAYRPEIFGDRLDLRHGGADGGPVQVEVYRERSRERLIGLARLALEEFGLEAIEGTARQLPAPPPPADPAASDEDA